MGEKEERAKLRMDQVMEKAQALNSKLNLIDDPKQMHDSEVHEKLMEGKEWERRRKVNLRMGQIMDKVQTLRSKLNLIDDPKQMHDSEVCEKLMESKEWEKTKDGIVMAMEKMQEDSIGTGVDLQPMVNRINDLADLQAAKIEGLKLVDKE